MSIKQSIAALFVLLSVSFSANATDYFRITRVDGNLCGGWGVGSIITSDLFSSACVGVYNPDVGKNVRSAFCLGNSCSACWPKYTESNSINSCQRIYTVEEAQAICSDGEEFNAETGMCEGPPDIPFCSKASTQQQMRDFESSCFADGGSPTMICNDQVDPPDFRMSCDIAPPPPIGCEPGSPSFPGCLDDENKCDENHPDWNSEYGMCCSPENNYCDVPSPESCTIFSANYPACMGDNDISPPDSGDLGDPSFPDGGASGGDGSGSTGSNKPKPDVDNTSDELSAIKSMNDDLNSQLNAINNDMNKNQAETKSALDALKASTDTNTQSVIDGANHVAGAINDQSSMLSEIGNKNGQLLTSINGLLNNGFGELVNGLNGVGDGLSGLADINGDGFGSVVDAIDGLSPVVTPGFGDVPSGLYEPDALAALRTEVEDLEAEYKQVLEDYKSYFNFNSGVEGGQYQSHDISLNWHGHSINQSNQVMQSLRDNSGIIGAVVLFVFGLLGIRAIGGAF